MAICLCQSVLLSEILIECTLKDRASQVCMCIQYVVFTEYPWSLQVVVVGFFFVVSVVDLCRYSKFATCVCVCMSVCVCG